MNASGYGAPLGFGGSTTGAIAGAHEDEGEVMADVGKGGTSVPLSNQVGI